ncbi:MAG: DEAD/DEAH box helicase [Coriobacteriaceae bacterium]
MGPRRARAVRVALKALGADVHCNLQGPLSAISELAAVESAPWRESPRNPHGHAHRRHPADERRKIARNPPDILITTPESLYSCSPRRPGEALRTVETVIVDEVHACRRQARAHLSLSLERLDDLLEARPSASGCRPRCARARSGRFLGGVRPVTVVATRRFRASIFRCACPCAT